MQTKKAEEQISCFLKVKTKALLKIDNAFTKACAFLYQYYFITF